MKSCQTRSSRDSNRSELELVRSAFLRAQSRRGVTVCCHVPVLGRCIDMAYVLRSSLVTIEFKLHDWRKAIAQAKDHRLAAHHSYICMPQRSVSDVLLTSLNTAGVGLLFFKDEGKWPFSVHLEAPASNEAWRFAREEAISYVLNNKGKWI